MDCKKIRVLLSSYQDEEVNERDRSEISSHLLKCESCRREFELLESVKSEIKKMGEIEPPQNFTPLIMGKIREVKRFGLFSVPSMVYSFVFIIFFVLGFLINVNVDSKSNVEKHKEVYISNLLVKSQNLSLIYIQDKTIDMITEEGNHEK